ncbi:UNVERIFIED_CONTAM: hypothetical protein GTU68_044057 [Idotea baltica]|nr:hypothetical protein [Idotea baltica]
MCFDGLRSTEALVVGHAISMAANLSQCVTLRNVPIDRALVVANMKLSPCQQSKNDD